MYGKTVIGGKCMMTLKKQFKPLGNKQNIAFLGINAA